MSWLSAVLGVSSPVVAAPMAGGPSTPELVLAVAASGSFGFLAAGYKTAAQLAEQIAVVRAANRPFGVNVFAPNPLPVDPAAYRRYAAALQTDGDRYDVDCVGTPIREDDDDWSATVDLLIREPVPVVSFTFGIPEAAVIDALRSAGTLVVQTVTSAAEARAAAAVHVDALAVQASAAGGHSGTLTPAVIPPPTGLVELVREIRTAVPLPLIAAGGLANARAVADVLASGAAAVMVGTVLLRADESGASSVHRAALADHDREPVVTRAFTGRPARGLRNRFIDDYEALAPQGYPAIHHLTSPLRRAAAAAGDAELVNLWAGTGYREATDEPVATILTRLSAAG